MLFFACAGAFISFRSKVWHSCGCFSSCCRCLSLWRKERFLLVSQHCIELFFFHLRRSSDAYEDPVVLNCPCEQKTTILWGSRVIYVLLYQASLLSYFFRNIIKVICSFLLSAGMSRVNQQWIALFYVEYCFPIPIGLFSTFPVLISSRIRVLFFVGQVHVELFPPSFCFVVIDWMLILNKMGYEDFWCFHVVRGLSIRDGEAAVY